MGVSVSYNTKVISKKLTNLFRHQSNSIDLKMAKVNEKSPKIFLKSPQVCQIYPNIKFNSLKDALRVQH